MSWPFGQAISPIFHLTFFFSKFIAVSGNSNEVKVFDALNGNKKYSSSKSKNYVRQICWDPKLKNTFYAVDWDSQLIKHSIS